MGKSFPARQLAALNHLPVLLEGEEGTIPEEILDSVFSKEDPQERFEWFIQHYSKILSTAESISNSGVDCITDVSALHAKAAVAAEEGSQKITEKIHLPKDIKEFLLIASKSKIREFITDRGRSSEEIEKAVLRAVKMQDYMLKQAEKQNIDVIDRSGLDFCNAKDLQKISKITLG